MKWSAVSVFIIPTIVILIIWFLTARHYRAHSSMLAQTEKKARWKSCEEMIVLTHNNIAGELL